MIACCVAVSVRPNKRFDSSRIPTNLLFSKCLPVVLLLIVQESHDYALLFANVIYRYTFVISSGLNDCLLLAYQCSSKQEVRQFSHSYEFVTF